MEGSKQARPLDGEKWIRKVIRIDEKGEHKMDEHLYIFRGRHKEMIEDPESSPSWRLGFVYRFYYKKHISGERIAYRKGFKIHVEETQFPLYNSRRQGVDRIDMVIWERW